MTSHYANLKLRVDTVLGWLVMALMGVAVLNVLWQVFTRYVLNSPSGYTDELARYLLIWVGLLGASYAMGKRMHLAIDLLPNWLEGRAKDVLGIVVELSVALFALFVMVFGGIRLVALTLMLEQTSAALRVPLGYVYLALPLSGTLIAFYAILFMLDHLRRLRGRAASLVETIVPSAAAFAGEVLPGEEPSPLRATATDASV
jgi:TRAP-type C4-dicarboxylate transport system permease small subunit